MFTNIAVGTIHSEGMASPVVTKVGFYEEQSKCRSLIPGTPCLNAISRRIEEYQ